MAYSEGYSPEIPIREWVLSFLKPRYLTLTIHTFIASYVALKFVFLIFRATSVLERWVFELTPLFLLSLQDLELALIAAAVAGTNAFMHFSGGRFARVLAIFVTGSMVVSIILALRTSPYYFDAVNMGRLVALGLLLSTVPLDHFDLLKREMPRRIEAPVPEYEYWGPEAPEDFDQVMESVDEALGLLEGSQARRAVPVDADDRAVDILEDLLSTISERTPVEEEAQAAIPDPHEVERRRNLFQNRMREIDDRLAANPADMDALFSKATYLAMRKQYREAMQALDEITRLDPYYPGVWHLKTKVYELMGNREMAELCRTRAQALE